MNDEKDTEVITVVITVSKGNGSSFASFIPILLNFT